MGSLQGWKPVLPSLIGSPTVKRKNVYPGIAQIGGVFESSFQMVFGSFWWGFSYPPTNRIVCFWPNLAIRWRLVTEGSSTVSWFAKLGNLVTHLTEVLVALQDNPEHLVTLKSLDKQGNLAKLWHLAHLTKVGNLFTHPVTQTCSCAWRNKNA